VITSEINHLTASHTSEIKQTGRKIPILIVDDEKDQRDRLRRICNQVIGISNETIFEATSLEGAISQCEANDCHVVLLDKAVGLANGISFIPDILSVRPMAKILIVTGSENIEDVVAAMKMGAEGYVVKKHSQDFIGQQIEKTLATARYRRKEERLRLGEDVFEKEKLEIKSPVMKRLLESVKMIAESNRPLLLLGESGVGKTTIAKLVHNYRSEVLKNTSRNFIGLNITAFSNNLVESELFGHEEGAFSGARRSRVGHIEMAHEGTLFLDEIGEIPLELQTKLLKVIEEKKFHRVGGSKEIRSDFKLICATNRDLEQKVKDKSFREDFYYRISVFPLTVPSLTERREDIPGLLKQLLPAAAQDAKRFIEFDDLPGDFIQALVENPPKQNIRGLEIALSQLLTLSKRNKDGSPILEAWTKIPELRALIGIAKPKGTNPAGAITLDELLRRPFGLITKDFPGLQPVVAAFENKIVLEASEKAEKVKDIPDILDISHTSMHQKVKRAKEWLANKAANESNPTDKAVLIDNSI